VCDQWLNIVLELLLNDDGSMAIFLNVLQPTAGNSCEGAVLAFLCFGGSSTSLAEELDIMVYLFLPALPVLLVHMHVQILNMIYSGNYKEKEGDFALHI